MSTSADVTYRDDKKPHATYKVLSQSLKRHFSSLSDNGMELPSPSKNQTHVRKRQTRSWDWKETHREDSKTTPRLAGARLRPWIADLCSEIGKHRVTVLAWQYIFIIFTLFSLLFCRQISPHATKLLSGLPNNPIPGVLCWSPLIKDLPQCAPSSESHFQQIRWFQLR